MAKIGEGHFAAWMRQGLRELRAAFYPESNIGQAPEYGLAGTATPGEVAEGRRGTGRDLEDEAPREGGMADQFRQAEGRQDRDDPPRDQDLER